MARVGDFRHAIVRPPARSLPLGITTAELGAPDWELATAQHGEYCAALRRLGLQVETLAIDEPHPDSTFIEDTAVIADGCAVVTRPGAASRAGEVDATRAALLRHFPRLAAIAPPGTVDGGDVCETERCVFIGVSARTSEAGASQLSAILEAAGQSARTIDIRDIALLHLKTGLSALGDGRLLVGPELAGCPELEDFETVRVGVGESYAANVVRIHGAVLTPAGFPRTAARLRGLGLEVVELGMSEFQKMDGGLSCLSLRF